MNVGPYCHFAQRDGVRAVFRQAPSHMLQEALDTAGVPVCVCMRVWPAQADIVCCCSGEISKWPGVDMMQVSHDGAPLFSSSSQDLATCNSQ